MFWAWMDRYVGICEGVSLWVRVFEYVFVDECVERVQVLADW